MKLFSDCSTCTLCAMYKVGCLAGIGDDDFTWASKDELIKRLDEGVIEDDIHDSRNKAIEYLKERYNYEYKKEEI